MDLIVTSQFGAYQVGDRITDQAAVKAIVESEQSAYVTQVASASPPTE
jgi:hypothetical protein